MANQWLSDARSSDLWTALEQMRSGMDDLYERWGLGPARHAGAFPPVNLFEAEDGYVLTAELPGLRSEEIDVSVHNNRVTLRGERRIEYPEAVNLHRRERPAGIFRRTVQLPVEVDGDKVEAAYRNGVLMLRIPKAPQHKPRRIDVQSR
jgi:HSP20 family protein